jgi:hypothetical protein
MEEIETECPPAPGLTLAEVGDTVASWAIVCSVLALLGVAEFVYRVKERLG